MSAKFFPKGRGAVRQLRRQPDKEQPFRALSIAFGYGWGGFLFLLSILSALGLSLGLPPVPAQAQIPELAQSPSFEVFGSVNWTVRYGLGDPRGLAQKGYSRGLFFNQNITLDADVSVAVERPVPGLLSLLAQIDNQQPDFLQSLSILFEAERWTAQFGDFPMGRPESPFASADRLLKGFKVDWQVNERLSLSAILSQVSGILQTKTFRGNTVEETVQLVPQLPDRPWAEMPYLCELQGSETYCNLRGLAHFFLGPDFVEGFTKIKLRFPTDDRLRELLEAYELGYLFDVIQEDPEPELDPSSYLIIPAEEGFYLALRADFETILRDQIFRYIDDYNLGLPPDAEFQEYPLSPGTDYERGFLEGLQERLTIAVDSLELRPPDAAYYRFYYLRHPEILEGSVRVEIRLLREEEFRPIDDPLLAGFEMNVYPEVGVLELIAPPEFFQNPESAVRVSYAYKSGAGTYVLGLSVLKGSERVYLNGELLRPGQDYLLEYETGFLILFVEVGPDDVLRIEYEVARGGLGGFAEYRRGFEGLTLQYQPWDGFTLFVDLLRAHDSPTAGVDPESLATMPNNHVVLGLSGVWEGEGFRTDFDLGFNVNVFPPDDNMKINQPNRIYAVHGLTHQGRELVLFGHRNGVQVYDVATGSWSGYGPAEGLAGLEVFDIDSVEGLVAFATSGGLSLLELEPGDPLASFARPADWRRFDERDGLPSSRVLSVLLVDGNNAVWVGTDKGLATAPLGDFEALTERKTWTLFQKEKYPELPSDRVQELAWAGGMLYVGTDGGLAVFDPSAERFVPVAELQGLEIRDLAADGLRVYAATDRGVYAIEGTRGVGRPFLRAVQAVALWEGELWAGTEAGLFGAISGLVPETEGRSITALGTGERALWAGEEADESYRLRLFEVAQPQPEGEDGIESGLRVRVYDAREAELDGEAKGRFSDLPAAEHTDLGWVGEISVSKQLGPLTLRGTLRSISPEFTPIGLLNREDRLQLSLGASYALSEALTVRVNHEEGLTDLFRSPTQVLRDSLGLSFRPEGGPTLDVDYAIDRLDHSFERPGFDIRRRSYTLSLGQTLLDRRLDLGLSAQLAQDEDPRRPGGGFLEGDLQGTARFRAGPDLRLNLALKQPLQLRFGRLFGASQLTWGADWTTAASVRELPLLGMPVQLTFQTGYQGSSRLPVFGSGGRFSLDQSANVQVQAARLQLGEVVLSPQGTFSLRSRDPFSFNSLLELGGDTTLQGQWGLIDGTLSLGRTFSTQGRTGLVRFQDRGQLSLAHRDLRGLRPTLELSGTLETLTHPLFGRIRNGQYQIALQLFWQKLDSPLTADLYLSRQAILTERERTVTYSFQQGIEYQLVPRWGLTPRLDVLLDYIRGERDRQPVEELSGEITLSASFAPIPEWTATVGVSYLFTTDATKPRPPAHSFAVTVQFGRTFQFF